MDWDKLRVLHAVAEAGSFTHAAERLAISQPAVSRQIASLEEDLKTSLFHRHPRGLVLTEQGELLYRAAEEIFNKLVAVETLLADSKTKPFGELRVTAAVGLGSAWLTPRMKDFLDLYPDISLRLTLSDEELDLSKREADVAIRMREPVQEDLIRTKLFTVHFHVYASHGYVQKFSAPKALKDLENHRLLGFDTQPAVPIEQFNWLEKVGIKSGKSREPVLRVNNLFALRNAVQSGAGIAVLPDYMVNKSSQLVPVLQGVEVPELSTYFVYPEELRRSKRVMVLRDFLIAKARQWSF